MSPLFAALVICLILLLIVLVWQPDNDANGQRYYRPIGPIGRSLDGPLNGPWPQRYDSGDSNDRDMECVSRSLDQYKRPYANGPLAHMLNYNSLVERDGNATLREMEIDDVWVR